MQVRFSTDDLPPRDRVKFWCDYFAKQAHSITPSEIPDPGAFRAEASGSVAGEFALLDIESGLEKVQRTAAEVAKDKTEAFFIRRFRRGKTSGPLSGRRGRSATTNSLVR